MTETDLTEACTKTKKKSKKLKQKHQGDLDPGTVDTSLVSSAETVDLKEEPKKKKKKKHKKERKETDLELSVSTVNEVELDTHKKKKKKIKENNVECDNTHIPVHVTDSAEVEEKPKKKKKKRNLEEAPNVPCSGDDVIVAECQTSKKKKKKKDKEAKEVDGAPENETQLIENEVVKSKKIKKSDEGNVIRASEDLHDQDTCMTLSSKQKKKKKDKSEREVERSPPASEIAEELSSKKKKKKKMKKKKDFEKVDSGTENDVVAVTEDCHVKPKKRKYEQESDNFEALEQQSGPIEYSMGKTKKKKKNRDASQADKESSKEYLQNENLTDNGQSQNQREESHSSLNGKEKADSGDPTRSEKLKRLLGGFRKVQANEEGQNTNSGVTPVGQWGTANLGSSDRQQKFMRLLGGFKKGTTQTKDGASGAGGLGGRKAFNKEEEEKVNSALESQFQKAMEMKLTSTKGIGLGFQEAPGANKIFYIDKSKSNSVKFEDSD